MSSKHLANCRRYSGASIQVECCFTINRVTASFHHLNALTFWALRFLPSLLTWALSWEAYWNWLLFKGFFQALICLICASLLRLCSLLKDWVSAYQRILLRGSTESTHGMVCHFYSWNEGNDKWDSTEGWLTTAQSIYPASSRVFRTQLECWLTIDVRKMPFVTDGCWCHNFQTPYGIRDAEHFCSLQLFTHLINSCGAVQCLSTVTTRWWLHNHICSMMSSSGWMSMTVSFFSQWYTISFMLTFRVEVSFGF